MELDAAIDWLESMPHEACTVCYPLCDKTHLRAVTVQATETSDTALLVSLEGRGSEVRVVRVHMLFVDQIALTPIVRCLQPGRLPYPIQVEQLRSELLSVDRMVPA